MAFFVPLQQERYTRRHVSVISYIVNIVAPKFTLMVILHMEGDKFCPKKPLC